MSTPIHKSTRSRRRTKVVAASVAIAAVGVAGGIALTSSAQASPSDQPAITVGPSPTFGTSPPFTFVTSPPTFGPPEPTLGTIPNFTLVTIFPPGSTDVTTTTEAATDTTEAPTATTEPTGTDSPSDETTSPDDDPGTALEGYTLDITAAQINCDGTIHVEYATTANPEPPSAADHLVVFNPTSNPVDFHVVETVGNAPNGAFAFEQLGSIEDTYRVFVIALFAPANLEGPKLVDQADVLLAPDCP